MPQAVALAPIEEKVLGADNLPSLPVVAIKVLELTQDPNVSASQIAALVRNDPALSAKLLKMANSSMFGMSKKVASLQQATVVLGLRTVKVLVLSFSLVDSFQGKHKGAFDFDKYWRRSLTTAVGAKLLAQAASNAHSDEAFIAGLLSDIGVLAAYRCAPDQYEPVVKAYATGGRLLQQIEQAMLGVTHAEISGRLLAGWGMPEMLYEVAAAHHANDFSSVSEAYRSLAGIVWSAAAFADLFCGDADSSQLSEMRTQCMQRTGIARSPLEEALGALDSQVKEVADLMALEIGQTTTYEVLRMQAVTQLAAMTMDAELGRAAAARQAESTRQQLERVSVQACTDALTEVANRRALEVHLDTAVARARETQGSLGLVMLDVDHFKRLNDTYGHQAGDQALQLIGRCLGKISKGPVFCARYGGEEFAIVVSDASVQQLQKLAESVRSALERLSFKHGETQVSFTASLGAVQVCFASEQADAAELVSRADEALYLAKRNGRNRVEVS